MSLARAFTQIQNPSKLTWQLLNVSFLQIGVQTLGEVSVFSLPPEKNKKSQSQNSVLTLQFYVSCNKCSKEKIHLKKLTQGFNNVNTRTRATRRQQGSVHHRQMSAHFYFLDLLEIYLGGRRVSLS